MLESLQLRNLATISDTLLEFEDGLNVLTGETGAGKSILIDGLLLALGDRADRNLVRPGAKLASVEAVFVDGNGGEMLIRREVKPQGRSRIFIDDELATLEEARNRISGAVDLHSQRSTPALLLRRIQQASFDEFGGNAELAAHLQKEFHEYSSMIQRVELLESLSQKGSDELELASHELSLIQALNPSREDYQGLSDERRSLKTVRTNSETLARIVEELSEDQGLHSRIQRFQIELAGMGSNMEVSADMLDQACIALTEAETRLRHRLDSIETAHWRIEEIDNRLDSYSDLLGRCGGSLDALLQRRTKLEEDIARLHSDQEELLQLTKRIPSMKSSLCSNAEKLSRRRQKAAGLLQEVVQDELRLLGMPDSTFEVIMPSPPKGRSLVMENRLLCSDGFELPEYHFSANRGMEPGPLSSVASGGELSRISLVLKLALVGVTQADTMIFDEIDSGIGGETANLLAESLRRASSTRQVIVITHLAQIASMAKRHLAVKKESGEDIPVTSVFHLQDRLQRIGELSRLLGGGDAAAEHAARLMENSSFGEGDTT